MTDYLDLLSICAYDVEKATEIIKEVLDEVGLEKLESKSDRALGGRLLCASGSESTRR